MAWDDFLGSPALSEMGVGEEGLERLAKEAQNYVAFPKAQQSPLPRLAVELIDTLRVRAIRAMGFDASIVEYIDPDITPSNRLLIVKPMKN